MKNIGIRLVNQIAKILILQIHWIMNLGFKLKSSNTKMIFVAKYICSSQMHL